MRKFILEISKLCKKYNIISIPEQYKKNSYFIHLRVRGKKISKYYCAASSSVFFSRYFIARTNARPLIKTNSKKQFLQILKRFLAKNYKRI